MSLEALAAEAVIDEVVDDSVSSLKSKPSEAISEYSIFLRSVLRLDRNSLPVNPGRIISIIRKRLSALVDDKTISANYSPDSSLALTYYSLY